MMITTAAYLSALLNGFVNWDDNLYVYDNLNIQSIDLSFFKWAFTSFHAINWHPLTWISHAADYAIWGLDPLGHHLTSIILHGLNTFLVVLLVTRLVYSARTLLDSSKEEDTFKVSIAAGVVTGFLFGLHPIHVESVAWVSERKDVLCAFFFLLSIISYLKYTSPFTNTPRNYILSLLFFGLALMSKPMAITLPGVLIILDIYPLQRLSIKKAFSTCRGVLVEKIPFFALSIAAAFVTIAAQQQAIGSLESYPFGTRIIVAIQSLGLYISKMLLPIGLAPLYPHPREISAISADFLLGSFLITTIIVLCVLLRGRKFWTAAWAYYLLTLLPVLGIIQVGSQAAADRYTYLPSLGPFILVGFGAGLVYAKTSSRKYLIASAILVASLLSVLTFQQIGIWKGPMTLWNRQLELHESYLAYNNRGNMYTYKENYEKAIADYTKALTIHPGYANAYFNRGIVYLRTEKHPKALMDFTRAIKMDPEDASAYNHRGIIYSKLKIYRKAVVDFNKAIKLDPAYAAAYYRRGMLYKKTGDKLNADKDFLQAVQLGDKRAREHLTARETGF